MTTIESKILKTIQKMPPSLQEELLHYAEYLQDKYVLTLNNQENNNVIEDFSLAWHEAMAGKTISVEKLWDEFDDE